MLAIAGLAGQRYLLQAWGLHLPQLVPLPLPRHGLHLPKTHARPPDMGC